MAGTTLKKSFSLTALFKGFKADEAQKLRAPLGSLVSQPSGFVHVAHIGFDKSSASCKMSFEGSENESSA